MSQFITCCFYFPASVDKTMSTLSCYNGIEHDCKIAAGWIFHTCRNFHAADGKTMLLVFHRTCTYCHIRKQVRKVTVIFRIKHLICTGHTTGPDCMDMHFTDCYKPCKKIWLFLDPAGEPYLYSLLLLFLVCLYKHVEQSEPCQLFSPEHCVIW